MCTQAACYPYIYQCYSWATQIQKVVLMKINGLVLIMDCALYDPAFFLYICLLLQLLSKWWMSSGYLMQV